MFRVISFFCSFDDFLGDDMVVRFCDFGFFYFVRNVFCDEMFEVKVDFCDFDGCDSRCKVFIVVMGKDCDSKLV